jgi:hypothetical protein
MGGNDRTVFGASHRSPAKDAEEKGFPRFYKNVHNSADNSR